MFLHDFDAPAFNNPDVTPMSASDLPSVDPHALNLWDAPHVAPTGGLPSHGHEPLFGSSPQYYDGMSGNHYRSDDDGYTWNRDN